MFDRRPITYGTPLHRDLADLAQGVMPAEGRLRLYMTYGWVDLTVTPPILTAEGRRFLEGLGPYPK